MECKMAEKDEKLSEVDPQELTDDEAANVDGGFSLGDIFKPPPFQDQRRIQNKPSA